MKKPTTTYEKLRFLSDAIYGDVTLCRDTSTSESVVVKRMDVSYMDAKISIGTKMSVEEDGRNEIKLMKKLQPHVNVVSLKASFKDKENMYVVTEYCSKGELYDIIDSQYNANLRSSSDIVDVVGDYANQVIAGISHLHRNNVAHRDLSLENVLVTSDNVAKLSDMGLAVRMASDNRVLKNTAQSRVGKIFYMAPEIYENARCYNPFKADMWSLGVMLFIMYTGFPPYSEPTMADNRFASIVRTGSVTEILGVSSTSVPRHVIDLIDALLTVDPASRPSIRDVSAVMRNIRFTKKNKNGIISSTCNTSSTAFSCNQQENIKSEECSMCDKKFRWYRKKATPTKTSNNVLSCSSYCHKCIRKL